MGHDVHNHEIWDQRRPTEAGVVKDDLVQQVQAWIAADPDPDTRAELQALLDAGDEAALADRFDGRLQFGTAGLRGAIGAGPQRMNRVIVRRAAWGFGRWLLDQTPGAADAGVAIGYDARRKSDVFAQDTAQVLAAMGIRAFLLARRLPTPLLAFAVHHLGCAGGVMVTASHNPPSDNGYKVYLADAAQIVAPADVEISARIDGAPDDIDLAPAGFPLIISVDAEVVDAYVKGAVAVPFVPHARDVRVAYTPLHGVGRAVAMEAFVRAGFPPPAVVAEQAEPDPTFPTVAFPNPEEPGAMDLLLALARSTQADIALANDPDADRLAAAIPSRDGWRVLSGNELGWLLADHVLQHTSGDHRLVVTTVVSSKLLSKMAAAEHVVYAETLTGFKWIARAIAEHPQTRFVFGYEQALGYLVGDTLTRDKDGITAALVMAEIAALAKLHGVTVQDRLDDIERRYGRHRLAERSLRLDPAEMSAFMEHLRVEPPKSLAGVAVESVTERADAELFILQLAGGARVLVRPSGTEPKVKLYAEVVGDQVDPDDLLAVLYQSPN
ncbi:MAG: phospho-sugar mutase [Acidimicrobiales bacterium]